MDTFELIAWRYPKSLRRTFGFKEISVIQQLEQLVSIYHSATCQPVTTLVAEGGKKPSVLPPLTFAFNNARRQVLP